MVLPFLLGAEGEGFTIIFQALFFGFIVTWIFFAQKIQVLSWLRQIEGGLYKLKALREEARETAIKTIKETAKLEEDPTPKVDHFLEYFFIEPVSMDPKGIVEKFDHLLDVRDLAFKSHVRRIVPQADETTINTLENLLEVSLGLNYIYKVVRHFYLYGRKTKAYIIVAQLYMVMPIILDIASAYHGALRAFSQGQPIGDGAGPLLASKLMRGAEVKKIEKDMVVAEVEIEGRKAYVLKAEGPGGNVGKPSEAIRALVESNVDKVRSVFMVDAALKFEGEESGSVSEGIGAAIGGIGTERFKIEEVAYRYKIPLYAVVIRQSLREAISPMSKKVYEGVNAAIERVKRAIRENSKEGDTIIIAGIGNTIGVGQ